MLTYLTDDSIGINHVTERFLKETLIKSRAQMGERIFRKTRQKNADI